MEDSKKLIEIIYKFISKAKNDDLNKLISGEYKLAFTNVEVKKKEILKDNGEIEAIYKKIKKSNSREEAKDILVKSKLTKVKLLQLSEFLEVKIPKSYNKDKIIERIVDIVIGWNLERETIGKVKLK
ncbi:MULTISPECIES: hypothetical protein [unclassified Romboutsia]|uniref:hypothetical protein n=1 Tax=unclassified Romboutsia TaxID=2626894 RepID=UPI000820E54A|nr:MULTISPECIES: hypothetical protein [unclassified Romboutsia]SCH47763.1 Uncharacterised protein [uncultured Clostridium sp.]